MKNIKMVNALAIRCPISKKLHLADQCKTCSAFKGFSTVLGEKTDTHVMCEVDEY